MGRVYLKKNLFQWTLRFYDHGGGEMSRLRFIPPTNQRIVPDLVALDGTRAEAVAWGLAQEAASYWIFSADADDYVPLTADSAAD